MSAQPRGMRDVAEQMADHAEAVHRAVTVIKRLRLWFDSSPAGTPDQTVASFTIDMKKGDLLETQNVTLAPPKRETDLKRNPLYLHMKRNRTYYFGVLAQAALRVPSLRDDAPQLANFNGGSAIWRLPIVGFEGDQVLVIKDTDKDDEFARELLSDDGSATIMQLAAPGTYGEALQGLLRVDILDKLEQIHPALLPDPGQITNGTVAAPAAPLP